MVVFNTKHTKNSRNFSLSHKRIFLMVHLAYNGGTKESDGLDQSYRHRNVK